MTKEEELKIAEKKLADAEGKIKRYKTFKLVKRLVFIAVIIGGAIGLSIYFPGIRDSVVDATSGIKSAVGDFAEVVKPTWTYNGTLDGISVKEEDDFITISRENLNQEVIPVVNALQKWGKSLGSDFLIFGGTLFRDSSGELIWRINGYDTSMGAVLAKTGKNGIFITDNPEGLRVPKTTVTTGTLSLDKETVRFLGFLWKTGDRYVVRAANFFGNYESLDDSEFYFTQNRLELARSESKLTPAICSVGIKNF
jgi:hypothetical protein